MTAAPHRPPPAKWPEFDPIARAEIVAQCDSGAVELWERSPWRSMNTAGLIAALGISEGSACRVDQRGPSTPPRGAWPAIDAETVRAWLVSKGLAKGRRVAATLAEAAGLLGVHTRTLSNWFAAQAAQADRRKGST